MPLGSRTWEYVAQRRLVCSGPLEVADLECPSALACTACFAVKYGVTQAVQRIDELAALQRSAVDAMGSSVANPGAAAIIAPYRGPADWVGPPAHGNIVGFVSKR